MSDSLHWSWLPVSRAASHAEDSVLIQVSASVSLANPGMSAVLPLDQLVCTSHSLPRLDLRASNFGTKGWSVMNAI